MYKILMCVFSPHIYNEIRHGFIEAGCCVRDFFIGTEFANRNDLLKTSLLTAIDEFKPDFIYSYGWWKDIVNIDEFLDVIKNKGIFHLWWSADDPICFNLASLPVATKCDLVLTPVEELIPLYSSYGVKAYLQPNGCPPNHVKVSPKAEYKHDMVLLANNYNLKYVDEETRKSIFYKFRLEGIHHILAPLVTSHMDVKVWGRWWTDYDRAYTLPERYHGGILPSQEAPVVYSSCKIVLGIQQVATSKTFVSVRTFEALGCSAFHITQYSQAIDYYFKKGVHLEWSQSPEETLDLVKFYLAHEDLRAKIAQNGLIEVNTKHRLVHRAKSVLNIIKLHMAGGTAMH